MPLIEAYFDGACEPVNPGGTASLGAVILVDGVVTWEAASLVTVKPDEVTSNNIAEYSGFIVVAEHLLARYATGLPVVIRGDSKLVVEQLNGRWNVNGGHYVPYHWEAQRLWNALQAACPGVTLTWIRRQENHLADKLSKQALLDAGVTLRIQPGG